MQRESVPAPQAYRRFREWTDTGVFEEFRKQGLLAYDQMEGIDWSWIVTT